MNQKELIKAWKENKLNEKGKDLLIDILINGEDTSDQEMIEIFTQVQEKESD